MSSRILYLHISRDQSRGSCGRIRGPELTACHGLTSPWDSCCWLSESVVQRNIGARHGSSNREMLYAYCNPHGVWEHAEESPSAEITAAPRGDDMGDLVGLVHNRRLINLDHSDTTRQCMPRRCAPLQTWFYAFDTTASDDPGVMIEASRGHQAGPHVTRRAAQE